MARRSGRVGPGLSSRLAEHRNANDEALEHAMLALECMGTSDLFGKMCLDFPHNNGGEAGFASPHINRESVTEEVVVRELLQNALDASLNTGPVAVEFRHESIPTQQLPLIKDYMTAFNAARAHRRAKVDSPAERQAIDRIRGCLRSTNQETKVLACLDRGRGIDTTALRSLYNTGDTTKSTGRGSVGLGHLTAFAASDLRYVLYAGRTTAGQETFGGHAILATSSIDGEQRDAHGYIRGADERHGSPASQARGSCDIPALVRGWLPAASSGSVAAILGYGPTVRTGSGRLEKSLLAAAAKSFVVAIHQGGLTVDCRVDGTIKASLNKETLAAALMPTRDQQRRRLRLGVLGREAWAAYETLQTGKILPVGEELDGVSIWVRDLAAGERTLVCVFREGMWITSHAPQLQNTHFANLAPFCAVVNVEDPSAGADENSICALVREAEGETHSQIRPSEITSPDKKKSLEEALKRIADVLRAEGKPSVGQVVEPDQLRIFRGRLLTPAPAPPVRRQETDDPPEEVTDTDTDGDDGGGSSDNGGGSSDNGGGSGDNGGGSSDNGGGSGDNGGGSGGGSGTGPTRRRVSARGNTSGIRVASRHLGARQWSVVWRAESVRSGGLRVMAVLPSGTDETTERQLSDTVLKLAWVEIRDRRIEPTSDREGREVRLPEVSDAGEALVELAEDVDSTDAAMVTMRLMHASGTAT